MTMTIPNSFHISFILLPNRVNFSSAPAVIDRSDSNCKYMSFFSKTNIT